MRYTTWLVAAAALLAPSSVHTQTVTTTNWNPSTGSGSGSNGNPFNNPQPGGLRPTACNGSSLFCSLRFDQYTFPATWRSGSYNMQGDCNSVTSFPDKCATFSESKCFFENHGNRDLLRQLNDGIRAFNFELCSFGGAPQNNYAVLCRTIKNSFGQARDLGEDVMDTADVLKYWLELPANRNETLEVEVEIVDDPTVTKYDEAMQYFITQFNNKIGKYLLRRTDTTRPWPTLGAMVQANKRVVVFSSDAAYNALTITPPNWLLKASDYYLPSAAYTQTTTVPDPPAGNTFNAQYDAFVSALVTNVPYTLANFCKHPDTGLLNGRWQNIDLEFFINYKCPVQIANAIQYFARQVAFFCLKYTYFHRLRAMTYFVGLEMRSLVRRINLGRYALLLQAIQNQQVVN